MLRRLFAGQFKFSWIVIILLAGLFSLPFLLPYLHSGYFPTHDGEWAVVRLGDMYRELKDLQFPPRYSGNLNFGYGYPLFEFAYPLPYYLGFLIHLLHISFVGSIKTIFAFSVPVSFLGMFLLAKHIWKSQLAGICCAILYIYYPYRLVDLYVRGSIGESLAFAIFPFIIYSLLRLHETQKIGYALTSGFLIALLITAHNIMAVEFLPIILIFLCVSIFSEQQARKVLVKHYLLSLGLGFGLACFFWLPALYEKTLISLSILPIVNINIYFVKLWQLIIPSWAYGTNNFSYQLGIPQIMVMFFSVLSFIVIKKQNNNLQFLDYLCLSLFGLFTIYFFLLFSWSALIWKTVPILHDITYPWTLLAPMGFLIAFFAGRMMKTKYMPFILIIIAIYAIWYCLPYARPSGYVNRGDGFYLTNDATTTSSDEYMPLWVKEKPLQRTANKFQLLQGKGNLSNMSANSKTFSADIQSDTNVIVQINTIYYPGWIIKVDGKQMPIFYQNNFGLMRISVPKGTHRISGEFRETPLRFIADLISLLTLAIVIFILVLYAKLYFEK